MSIGRREAPEFVNADLYVWQSPRDIDPDVAEAMIAPWEEGGGDPAGAPFGPSSDVGWFHRELIQDHPGLDVTSDATPSGSKRPVWLETEPESPARIVAIRLPAQPPGDVIETIYGLATKYDLVIYDRRSGRVHLPLAETAAYASATFWPRGAIQAALAGVVGAVMAAIAWFAGVPVVSGVLVAIGGFLALMSIITFAHAGRDGMRGRDR